MPTIKDRIQVLLKPEDYAAVKVMADEEERSMGSMGAVLIKEAVLARRRAGTFLPDPSANDQALQIARLRRLAKQMGKGTNELVQEEASKRSERDELLDLMKKILDN